MQLTLLIKDKGSLGEDKLEALKEVVGEEDKAREIIEVSCWGCERGGGERRQGEEAGRGREGRQGEEAARQAARRGWPVACFG